MSPGGHLLGGVTGSEALIVALTAQATGGESTDVPGPYIVAAIAIGVIIGVGWKLWQRRLRTGAIYRAWVPFSQRNDEGVAGKHGRPVLVLEKLGDGTVLVLEGTSQPTGYGSRVDIGLGGWCSRRDIATRRVTYLRTDRCLRIQRSFIDRRSGPHRLPKRLSKEVLRAAKQRVEDRLTPPTT
jgi:hypothetical protein